MTDTYRHPLDLSHAEWTGETHRVCSKCGQHLPLDERHFYVRRNRNPWTKSYYFPYCKACDNKRAIKWQQENRERRNAKRLVTGKLRTQSRKQAAVFYTPVQLALAAKRKDEDRRKKMLKAALGHVQRSQPGYQGTKHLYGRWKGMTSAQRWAIEKAEAAASADVEAAPPGADQRAELSKLNALIESNRAKYGTTPRLPGQPVSLPFGGTTPEPTPDTTT